MANLEEPEPLRMMKLLFGGLTTQMVALAVQLRVADRLKDGPASARQIAEERGLLPEPTYRWLRGLSSLGVLEEHADRSFSLTSLGGTLRSDIPGSLAGLGWLAAQPWHHAALAELQHALATGESGFFKAHGCGMFDWLSARPEQARVFSEAMSSFSAVEAQGVASAYDFSRVRRVADIGGGHGLLLAEILTRYPELHGVLFELPHAEQGALATFAERGLTDRTSVLLGDFFETMPEGCDVYLFKHVLHDWDDARARAILGRLTSCMRADSRVLIAEQVLPPDGVPHFSKIMDVGMLALTEGGKERTQAEHAALLASSGLTLIEVTPTAGPLSLLEARLA